MSDNWGNDPIGVVPKTSPHADWGNDPVQSGGPAQKETSQLLGLYQGAIKPLDNAAMAVDYLAKHLGIDSDKISRALGMPTTQEAVQAHQNAVTQSKYAPGGLGKFTGEVLGTVPVALENPWLAGAATGGLLSDAKNPQELAADVGVGALGGKIGEKAIKGVSGAISPKLAPAVQKLIGEGVKMTPGQIIGGAGKRLEDVAGSLPFVGSLVRGAQKESVKSFNQAAANRALGTIGKKLPDNIEPGHDTITHVGDELGKAYEKLLPNLSLNLDKRLGVAVRSAYQSIASLPKEKSAQFLSELDNKVFRRFTQSSSAPGKLTMNGKNLKEAESQLTQLVKDYKSSPDPDQRALGRAYEGIRAGLRDAVSKSNPQHAKELANINKGWAHLAILENASKGAGTSASGQQVGGIFTPAQLQTAVRGADSTARKRATARGTSLMQDLAEAAGARLPQSVPDSGTPERLITEGLLSGGGAYGLGGIPGLAGLGGIAGLYTATGQKLARALLTKRPAAAKALAQQVMNGKRGAQQLGAVSATDVLNQITGAKPF